MKGYNCMIAGCEFTGYTGTPGVLSAAELNKIVKDSATMAHDRDAAAKIVTWNSSHWASFYNAETPKRILAYAFLPSVGYSKKSSTLICILFHPVEVPFLY
jgi:chitinase